MKQFLLSLIFLLVAPLSASADWGAHCNVYNSTNFRAAIDAYNKTGSCGYAIRFMQPVTISLPEGLVIDRNPSLTYGTAIRRCSDLYGKECEGDYENDQFVLDFSDYEGDCPVKIVEGDRIDFIRFHVISKTPARTFCTIVGGLGREEGFTKATPIPLEDNSNTSASIRSIAIN